MSNEKAYLDHLAAVAEDDVAVLQEKDKQYGGSWKRRGGAGAYMMLARKWDRLEQLMAREATIVNRSRLGKPNVVVGQYDIFGHIQTDTRQEGVIDDIRDLRRYLLLIEAEARAQQWGPYEAKPAAGAVRMIGQHDEFLTVAGVPSEGGVAVRQPHTDDGDRTGLPGPAAPKVSRRVGICDPCNTPNVCRTAQWCGLTSVEIAADSVEDSNDPYGLDNQKKA